MGLSKTYCKRHGPTGSGRTWGGPTFSERQTGLLLNEVSKLGLVSVRQLGNGSEVGELAVPTVTHVSTG